VNGLTIKKRFIALVVFLTTVVILEGGVLLNGNVATLDQATHITENEIPILSKAHELKLTVVQVQQWLTDISATRGLDGLNDGFDEAENNAKVFRSLLQELQALDKENAEHYQAMLPIFDAYYSVGKKMAQAYIDEGPASGNKMMAQFDAVAAKMTAEVDNFPAKTKLRAENALLKQHDVATTNRLSLIIGSIMILLGIGLLYLFMTRALAHLPLMAAKLAGGDLTTSFAVDRKDEIGQIMNSMQSMRQRQKRW